MQKRESVLRNIRLTYLFSFLGGLMFFIPIYALYLQQELFTVFNVTLIIALQSIATLIFEVPSGAVADLFGRKNTLIFSRFLAVIALIFLAVGNNLIFFVIYAILNALAMSLVSGTDTALIFDSIKGIDKTTKKTAMALSEAALGKKEAPLMMEGLQKKPHFKKVMAIKNSMWPIGASISSLVGGFLAITSLRLPIFATIIPFSLAFFLAFFLKEPKYKKETHKNIFSHMFSSTKIVLKKKQVLLLTLLGFLFYSFIETPHQLNAIFFEFKAIPLNYYGFIFAGMFLLSFFGALSSYWVSNKIGNKNTIIISALMPPFLLFGSTLVFGVWAGIFIIISALFWGIRWPVMMHLLNLEIESKHRATIISIGNLLKKFGLAIFAPIFGYFVDLWNINTAFKISAGLSLITFFLVFFIKEKD